MSITIVETTYNLSIPQNFLNSLYNLYIFSIIFFTCIFLVYLTLNFYNYLAIHSYKNWSKVKKSEIKQTFYRE